MKVEHFKIVDDGRGGIIVNGTDVKEKESGIHAIVDFSLTFRTPIPNDLFDHIQKLKLFFLQLTGHWEDGLSKYLEMDFSLKDQENDERYLRAYWLYENTVITGLKAKDDYYIITGKITNRYGQTIGMSSPKVTYDTAYSGFSHMVSLANELVGNVEKFVNDRKLRMMEPRQYVLDLFKDAEPHDLESIRKMNDEQVREVLLSELERKNAIVIGVNVPDNKEEPKDEIFVKKDEGDVETKEKVEETEKSKTSSKKDPLNKSSKPASKAPKNVPEVKKQKVKTAEEIAADDF
jgi:hypothetical protein